MLARNPVKALGAFQAQDSTLQSNLPLTSPFQDLHIFTHSIETDIEVAEAMSIQKHRCTNYSFRVEVKIKPTVTKAHSSGNTKMKKINKHIPPEGNDTVKSQPMKGIKRFAFKAAIVSGKSFAIQRN